MYGNETALKLCLLNNVFRNIHKTVHIFPMHSTALSECLEMVAEVVEKVAKWSGYPHENGYTHQFLMYIEENRTFITFPSRLITFPSQNVVEIYWNISFLLGKITLYTHDKTVAVRSGNCALNDTGMNVTRPVQNQS